MQTQQTKTKSAKIFYKPRQNYNRALNLPKIMYAKNFCVNQHDLLDKPKIKIGKTKIFEKGVPGKGVPKFYLYRTRILHNVKNIHTQIVATVSKF